MVICTILLSTSLLPSFVLLQSSEQLSVDDLRRHPFLATGRWAPLAPDPTIRQVSSGEMAWINHIAKKEGGEGRCQEFNDATVLSDGNVVSARMTGASLTSPQGKELWYYSAPFGTEIDSIQGVAKDRVLVMQSGVPAKALFFDTKNNRMVKSVVIPTSINQPHDMFRHVRMTLAGTILVTHLAENKVCEYDLNGKLVWSMNTPSPWHVQRLWNGNTLIAGDWHHYAKEVNKKGETVWQFNQRDLPNVPLGNVHIATRLSNGNTLLGFWYKETPKAHEKPGSLQILELTRYNKVVWSISSLQDRDFSRYIGPINTIQLLDQAVTDDNVYAGP